MGFYINKLKNLGALGPSRPWHPAAKILASNPAPPHPRIL